MATGLLHGGQLLDSFGNNVQSLLELSLSDDQRRSKSDDVAVGGLGL